MDIIRCFLSQGENFICFCGSLLALMNKFELVIPWWLGTDRGYLNPLCDTVSAATEPLQLVAP